MRIGCHSLKNITLVQDTSIFLVNVVNSDAKKSQSMKLSTYLQSTTNDTTISTQSETSRADTMTVSPRNKKTTAFYGWPLGLARVRRHASHRPLTQKINRDPLLFSHLSTTNTIFANTERTRQRGHNKKTHILLTDTEAVKDSADILEQNLHIYIAASQLLNTFVLPLSTQNMRNGYNQIRRSVRRSRQIKQRKDLLQTQCNALNTLENSSFSVISRAEILLRKQMLADIAIEKTLNTSDFGKGLSEAIAGSATCSNVSLETGTALLAESSSVVHFISAAGVVCSLVLGPLTSIATLSLGAFFLHQSLTEKFSLSKNSRRIRHFLQTLDTASITPHGHAYRIFLTQTLAQQQGFIARYNTLNAFFSAGSCAYAIGTLAKVGINIAAISGVSVIAGPIGIGFLTGMCVIGMVLMAMSSHQHIIHRQTYKQLRNYEHQDMEAVDRQFLVVVDIIANFLMKNDSPFVTLGYELRAELYAKLEGQETSLNDFLKNAAQIMQKKAVTIQRSSLPRIAQLHTDSSRAALPKKGFAVFHAAGAFCQSVFRGKAHAARKNAKIAFACHSCKTTRTGLSSWLSQPASSDTVLSYMQTVLELEKRYLTLKRTIRQKCLDFFLPFLPPLSANVSNKETQTFHSQQVLIAALELSRARDDLRLCDVTILLDALVHSSLKEDGSSVRQIKTWQTQFLVLFYGADQDEAKESSFAAFCMRDAFNHTTAARGILLAVEKQIARVAEQFHPS